MSGTTLYNILDQSLDIAGSLSQSDTMILSNEPLFLGKPIAGQTGSVGVISAASGGIVTLTALTGFTAANVGQFLTLSGASNAGNNGTFIITSYHSSTSIDISNASGVFPDANSGSLTWTERGPYVLQDDLNYERTDRSAIKGVSYYLPVPTYTRPSATGTNVAASLSNIAGKTTDAKAIVTNRKFEDEPISAGASYFTLTASGQLKHADSVDTTGVPCWDSFDAGNWNSTFVEIVSPSESELTVTGGAYDGYRIFGRARSGSSTSPNSVEVQLMCVKRGQPITTGVPYTWDGYQPTSIDVFYPYRVQLDQMDESAWRVLLVNGLVGSSNLTPVYNTIGVSSGASSLAGALTNLTSYFPFYSLGTATPTVVQALNVLNSQIGNMTYTGGILTSGQTISASLQALASSIGASSGGVRIIERVVSIIPANTAHTLPAGKAYTVDGTYNGKNMLVFTRGLLRDPGPVSDGNDYEETSTTQITFYSRINAGDHIDYIIYA